MNLERLQKILAQAGYGSRRSCETLIREGRVRVDGEVATLGQKADAATQIVTVDGQRVRPVEAFTYIALYKPRGVLSDTDDPRGRRTVLELVPPSGHLFAVGRLDLSSEGLVILTDDGALANRLLHPRYGHEREYHVLVEGRPSLETLAKWRQGVFLDEVCTLPAEVHVLRVESGDSWLSVTMREGKKRQIRRVAATLGHQVRMLVRVRIGPIDLGKLKAGQWRNLTQSEIRALRTAAESPASRRG
jgi:23S rRNA pseudouridine2605 synthase